MKVWKRLLSSLARAFFSAFRHPGSPLPASASNDGSEQQRAHPPAPHSRRNQRIVHQLLDERHRLSRAARRARWTQAGAPARAVRDERARASFRAAPTRSPRRSSATCSASTTRTATSRCTTRSCAWCRISRCAIRWSTARETSAASTAIPRRRTGTPNRASLAIAMEMLADIDKNTVDFAPNFDDRLQEPKVLPSAIPNLVVNGSSGIAVGMATNIPPHNLREVVAALTALIDNPELTPTDIRKLIKGPDFPTGGYIYGRAGIKDYQETGRGRIVMRARAVIEEKESSNKSQIVVTELPYQVNKARLVEHIAELVRDKKLEGICDLRDESGPRRHARRHRAQARCDSARGAQPAVQAHGDAVDVRRHHAGARARFTHDAARAEGDAAQGSARALHRAPAPGRRPPHAVRARQGARARAHPRRPQDRRRQHRRGDQAHSRGRRHADGERAAPEAVQAERAAGRGDPQHAPRQAHRPGDREAGGGAQGGAGVHQGSAARCSRRRPRG